MNSIKSIIIVFADEVATLEFHIFSYFYDRAVEMGLIGNLLENLIKLILVIMMLMILVMKMMIVVMMMVIMMIVMVMMMMVINIL